MCLQMCCYSSLHNSLLSGPEDAGFPISYSPFLSPTLFAQNDLSPFGDCCAYSDYCALFREFKPILTCVGYSPPRPGTSCLALESALLLVVAYQRTGAMFNILLSMITICTLFGSWLLENFYYFGCHQRTLNQSICKMRTRKKAFIIIIMIATFYIDYTV